MIVIAVLMVIITIVGMKVFGIAPTRSNFLFALCSAAFFVCGFVVVSNWLKHQKEKKAERCQEFKEILELLSNASANLITYSIANSDCALKYVTKTENKIKELAKK